MKSKKPPLLKSKRGILLLILIIVVAVAIFSVIVWNNTNRAKLELAEAEAASVLAYNTYIDDLKRVQSLMLDGGSEAESMCNFTIRVWKNAINQKREEDTSKYTHVYTNGFLTRENDFSTALELLYSDSSTIEITNKLKENQKAVKKIMDRLNSPPPELEKVYDTVTDLYTAYKGLTDLAITPTGSLQSYSDDKSQKTNSIIEYYNKLETQIPSKKDIENSNQN